MNGGWHQSATAPFPTSLPRLVFAEAVADAADGLDQVSAAAGLGQLPPQRFDVHVNRPFQHNRPLADGRVHELMTAERPAGLADERFEQAELGRRQVEWFAI